MEIPQFNPSPLVDESVKSCLYTPGARGLFLTLTANLLLKKSMPSGAYSKVLLSEAKAPTPVPCCHSMTSWLSGNKDLSILVKGPSGYFEKATPIWVCAG